MSDDDYREMQFSEDYLGIDQRGYEHHPIDDIEPIVEEKSGYNNGFRDCAKESRRKMNLILSFIAEAENARAAAYVACFCTGSAAVEGRSMNEIADNLGMTRAAISKQVKSLQRQCQFLPTPYMKSELACLRYSKARIASVKANKKNEEAQ